jgi:DNA-binding Lrp family transcriptional regulator
MDRLDATDARILTLLQQDGRIKRSRVAEEVGLSVPSVSDRMRKLEERGLITGYHAAVDARRLGLDVTAFIRVTITGSEFDVEGIFGDHVFWYKEMKARLPKGVYKKLRATIEQGAPSPRTSPTPSPWR